jgi:hypothetical protein
VISATHKLLHKALTVIYLFVLAQLIMEEVLNVEDVHGAEFVSNVEVIESFDSSDEDLKKVEKVSAVDDHEDEFDLVSHSMPILVRWRQEPGASLHN